MQRSKIMEPKPLSRGRYAPTPSGRLHLGNLLTCLLTWLDARSTGSDLLFRLEDLDAARCSETYAVETAEDLRWMGLDWDSGWFPEAPGNYAQSTRSSVYAEAFQVLQQKGLLYPCYCSRVERQAASAPHPGQPKDAHCRCRTLTALERREKEAAGRRPAWKVCVPDTEISFTDLHYGPQTYRLAELGDFIVRRSDGVFSYQLAVAVDDALMGVTRVVRARDLMPSAARQICLLRLLDLPEPAYAHGPLLVSAPAEKLSKREGALNMLYFRRQYSPRELCGLLAYLCGLRASIQPLTPAELLPDFAWERVSRKDILLPSRLAFPPESSRH